MTEEAVLIVLLCVVFAAAGYAAQVLMPIRTNLISCGHREDLPAACREDQRCCALLEQSSARPGDPPAENEGHGGYSNPQEALPPIETAPKSSVTFE